MELEPAAKWLWKLVLPAAGFERSSPPRARAMKLYLYEASKEKSSFPILPLLLILLSHTLYFVLGFIRPKKQSISVSIPVFLPQMKRLNGVLPFYYSYEWIPNVSQKLK